MAVAPQRGLPVPPQPMIPPEGLPPPPEATAPDASPTTMVLNYLQSRGFPPTTDNVRRALEANARDPGVIPGLRSDVPATEADDQAAMAAAGVGGGRRGGRPGLPTPPPALPPPAQNETAPAQPPAGDTSGVPGVDDAISGLGALITGGVPLAAYSAYKLANRGGGSPNTSAAPGAPPAGPPASDLEAAMEKAIQGRSEPDVPQLGGPPKPLAITDQRVPMQAPPDVAVPPAPVVPPSTDAPNVVGQAGRPGEGVAPNVPFTPGKARVVPTERLPLHIGPLGRNIARFAR